MKLWNAIVSLFDPNLIDRRKVLKDQEELWQQYLDLEARVVASGIKRREWRERVEREFRNVTAKAPLPGSTYMLCDAGDVWEMSSYAPARTTAAYDPRRKQ